MSYYCDKYPIIEKKSISRDTFSITIYAPEAAKAAHAGQFANISAPGFTLRRPISICEFSRSRGTLRFVFEVRGKLRRLSSGRSAHIKRKHIRPYVLRCRSNGCGGGRVLNIISARKMQRIGAYFIFIEYIATLNPGTGKAQCA